jgi:GNAT superfamily N-acetyltransferase
MSVRKANAISIAKARCDRDLVASVSFTLSGSLHENCVEADFVHSIVGRIIAEPENGEAADAGRIGASLVQFGEALDPGISTERLGDGISGNISEYWELLFDMDTGYLKEEIQNEYEVAGLDLLVIDYVEIHPKFRGLGIGVSAIHRTIDVFGAGCGLIACKPWPLQFTPAVAGDQRLLKTIAAPKVGKHEALRKVRAYWSRLGFWPLGNSGIYVLSVSQRGCQVSPSNCKTGIRPSPGSIVGRTC